jgi:hypothetical protein
MASDRNTALVSSRAQLASCSVPHLGYALPMWMGLECSLLLLLIASCMKRNDAFAVDGHADDDGAGHLTA